MQAIYPMKLWKKMLICLIYCKREAATKTVPIDEKRKRGIPAKTKLDLLVQQFHFYIHFLFSHSHFRFLQKNIL